MEGHNELKSKNNKTKMKHLSTLKILFFDRVIGTSKKFREWYHQHARQWVSRDSYCRFQELYVTGGKEALYTISRKKPIIANRVDPLVEKAVIDIAIEYPAYGQLRVSNELKKRAMYLLVE